jgi:hypothetical protein
MQNDFRKYDFFDRDLINVIFKHMNENEKKIFELCIKKLPFDIVKNILINLIKNKCIQINI